MTHGDLCAAPSCHDVAAPGKDFCVGCYEDELHGRQITAATAAALTAAHEAEVNDQDEVVAA